MSEAIRRVGRGGEGAPRVDGCCACINRYELFYSEGRFAYRTSTSARSDEPLREKMQVSFGMLRTRTASGLLRACTASSASARRGLQRVRPELRGCPCDAPTVSRVSGTRLRLKWDGPDVT